MISDAFSAFRLRGLALWAATTAAAAGVLALSLPALVTAPTTMTGSAGFTELLVAGCAAASAVAAGWLWVITTDVVVRVLVAGRAERVVVRRTGAVRLLLLTACGVVALGAAASPARADDERPTRPAPLSGLPLPDRAVGGAVPLRSAVPEEHLVRPGDSLWAIAEERLGRGARVAEIVDQWHRIYHRNAGVIGPDPDLILPGQRLDLPHRHPRPLEEDR